MSPDCKSSNPVALEVETSEMLHLSTAPSSGIGVRGSVGTGNSHFSLIRPVYLSLSRKINTLNHYFAVLCCIAGYCIALYCAILFDIFEEIRMLSMIWGLKETVIWAVVLCINVSRPVQALGFLPPIILLVVSNYTTIWCLCFHSFSCLKVFRGRHA